ncbi:hypothetical protein GCK32_002911 [Trichostrongylus colubriformis]|uniref:Aminopeptidase n=1 Tax=Trichostrongylus colubriformis TaxID=6319 RepID=A0AAN8IQC4_TRICO
MSSSDENSSHISIEFGEQDSKEAQKRRVASRFGFCAVVLVAISFAVLIIGTLIGWKKTYSFLENSFGTSIPDYTFLRLPGYVRPLTYNLTVKVYLPSYPDVPPEKELTFDGEVDILVEVLAPTNLIILHMLDIGIKNVHVLMNEEDIFVQHKSNERMEVGVFLLRSTIPAKQRVRVKVVYTGVVQTDRLSGLYRTTYKDINGSLKTAAVTHFEPSSARRMVPCFDEPDFKANWTVTIIHPEGTTALSNGKEIGEVREKRSPWITSTFEETPKMSTYILAIAVSEFKFEEGYTEADVRIRVWARPEALNGTSPSLRKGYWHLDFYGHHFGIKYPLPKLDLLSLPDFPAGAMENWGLNTYKEDGLWNGDEVSPELLVAHEFAHQWFGNLVTLKWWNDIWLNEGFATYMSFEAVGAKKSLLVDALERALQADSLATSHPLSFKVDKPVEVDEGFDTLSYEKGACLLGMIATLMGEENFNKGVRRYLKKFSYGNARSQDLWDVLDTVTTHVKGPDGNNLSMKKFADQWTVQMGFPLVTVKAANSSYFEITQSRYKKDPNAMELEKYRNPEYGFKWEVPIWYKLDDQPVKLAWLKRDSPLHIFANTQRSILVVNAHRHGFYRQNYDEEGWRKITEQLISNHEIYSRYTITAIIHDAFAAAAINRLNYTTVLRLLERLERNKVYFPLEAAYTGLGHIRSHISREKDLKSFQRYMKKLLGSPLEASYFWMMSVGSYCALDNEECIARSARLFEEGVIAKCGPGAKASSCVWLYLDGRRGAYCYGIKELGNQAYDKVMELLRMETVPNERERLISALGCHKDVSVLRSTLELAMNSELFRLQEVSSVFEGVASNFVAKELVFNFLLENWNKIYRRLRGQFLVLNKVIEVCLNVGYTEEHYNKIKNFMSEHKEADELNQFHKALEIVRIRITWIHDHLNTLLEYFQQNQSVWLSHARVMFIYRRQFPMSSSDENSSHISIEFGEQDSKEAHKGRVASRLGFCAVLLVAISFAVLIIGTSIGWKKTYSFFENSIGTSIPDYTFLRLPDYVRPMTYNLTMKVYLPSYPGVPPEKELSFDGEVDILVEVLAPTNLIILHMLDMEIRNVHVLMNGEDIFIQHKSNERMEVGVFLLRSTIPAKQRVRVKVIYTGVIQTNRLNGLYRTTYKDIDGSLKMAAVSHSEPIHARRIVPCFDEPDFKANWTVTIVHPEGTTAASNGKEIDKIREKNSPWITTTFEETPKMSTYILAIAVSEFKFVENYTQADVRFRVWSRPAAPNMASDALPTGIQLLDFYDTHFGIKYPLPKLDMLALPDFPAGAMENWGLITYRESVLWNDGETSGSLVIAHELAHQWFGNLVTLKWWNDIWLNEGFATYMSFEATGPRKKSMLVDAIERALQADSLATSHPLSFKIDKSVEVEEGFDTISYSKGASLLGMIAALMGEENFNKGVKRYLMKFSYGNARSHDLWDALDTVTTHTKGPDGNNLNIKKFADQWTTQMGFPLVTVKAANSSFFEITQSRYKKNPAAVEVEKYRNPEYGFKWEVPIWYQLDDQPVKLAWLRRDIPLHISANTERSTLVVNAERRGFYRQNYDGEGWRKIMQQLISNYKIYSDSTRTAIIKDAFAAAAVNRLNYITVLRLLEHLKRKKDQTSLYAAYAGLGHIRSHIHTEKDLVSFQRYMTKVLGLKSYGSILASYFWMELTGSYCPVDAEECSAKYVEIFEEGVLSKCEPGIQASACVE